MYRKRWIAAILAALLALTALPALAAYTDTATHWAAQEINKWSDLGILKGDDGLFRPNDPITRGEMAVILDRLMDYQRKAQNHFTDLENTFYTDAILGANAAGVILGDEGTVRPKDAISRQEAAVMLGRALGVTTGASSSLFSDRASIATWAVEIVDAMAAKGYIGGRDDGRFDPQANITRGEIVKILDNAVGTLYQTSGTFETSGKSAIVNTSYVTLKNCTIQGDLIVSEGVTGGVTLDGVTVTGSVILRGGALAVSGNSTVQTVLVQRKDGGAGIGVQDGAVVDTVRIENGSTVSLTGNVSNVLVKCASCSVTSAAGRVENMTIDGTSGTFTLGAGATAGTARITRNGGSSKVIVQSGSTLSKLTSEAESVTVSSSGKLVRAEILGNNNKLDCPGTVVTVGEDVTGTTASGKAIAGGLTGKLGEDGTLTPLPNSKTAVVVLDVTIRNANTVEVVMDELKDVEFSWNGVKLDSTRVVYGNGQYVLTVPGSKATNNQLVASKTGLDSYRDDQLDFTGLRAWNGEKNYAWYYAASGKDYYISAPADLAGLADIVNGVNGTGIPAQNSFVGKNIILLNDLDMGNRDFTGIGGTSAFSGSFDGGGHKLTNLKVTGSGNTGLFASVLSQGNQYQVIANLTVEGGSITGSGVYTGLIGYCRVEGSNLTLDGLTMKDVKVSATGGTGSGVGGIAGGINVSAVTRQYTDFTVKNCTVSGTLSAPGGYAGGIAGVLEHRDSSGGSGNSQVLLQKCDTSVSFLRGSSPATTGGILGAVTVNNDSGNRKGLTVEQCTANGVTGASTSLKNALYGGVAGRLTAVNGRTVNGYYDGGAGYRNVIDIQISGCTNTADGTGAETAGGMLGEVSLSGYSGRESDITANQNSVTLTNCKNSGAMGGGKMAGGMVGYYTADSQYLGTVLLYLDGCVNSGVIRSGSNGSADYGAGGMVGQTEMASTGTAALADCIKSVSRIEMRSCRNEGSVSSPKNSAAGGMVGLYGRDSSYAGKETYEFYSSTSGSGLSEIGATDIERSLAGTELTFLSSGPKPTYDSLAGAYTVTMGRGEALSGAVSGLVPWENYSASPTGQLIISKSDDGIIELTPYYDKDGSLTNFTVSVKNNAVSGDQATVWVSAPGLQITGKQKLVIRIK